MEGLGFDHLEWLRLRQEWLGQFLSFQSQWFILPSFPWVFPILSILLGRRAIREVRLSALAIFHPLFYSFLFQPDPLALGPRRRFVRLTLLPSNVLGMTNPPNCARSFNNARETKGSHAYTLSSNLQLAPSNPSRFGPLRALLPLPGRNQMWLACRIYLHACSSDGPIITEGGKRAVVLMTTTLLLERPESWEAIASKASYGLFGEQLSTSKSNLQTCKRTSVGDVIAYKCFSHPRSSGDWDHYSISKPSS